MTEKRFTKYVPDSYGYTYITTIIDNEKNKQTGNTDEIVDMLNELAEENKELQTKNNAYLQDIEVYREENTHLKLENDKLKSKNRGLQSELQIFKEDVTHSNLQINKLIDENEQLKQFQDRVFSWIDMHLQRLPTLRDDEFEFDNEFADPSLYSGAIQILETMKRELKGDVE